MKYLNTLTGHIIDVACDINGDNWVILEESAEVKTKTIDKVKPKKSAKSKGKKDEAICND